MDATNTNNTNNYFNQIIKKFGFIQQIYVTDYEGAIIAVASRPSEESKENINNNNSNNDSLGDDKKEENEKNNQHNTKISLSFLFNSAIEQITKIEKWKIQNFVTIFDTATIFQSRISKSIFAHFICDSKNFNYEILKEISIEFTEKLQALDKEIDSLTQNNDNN